MNRNEAIDAVAKLLTNGQRIDRYLRHGGEKHGYYLTDAECYIDNDGPYNPPSVKIPAYDAATPDDLLTDESLEESAEYYVSQLDELLESADA